MALLPMGMVAQSAQHVYANAEYNFESSNADLGTPASDEVSAYGYEVSDKLMADPNFDIQENMISYTKDGKQVYFSANKKLKVRNNKAADVKVKKSVQLQLFRADVTESGAWVNLEMMDFNGPKHSTGHPALNSDDSQLFFVADGPLSTGKTDIFMVELNEDGSYGKPMNLGAKINSEEREVFPYVDEKSVLYFASDANSSEDNLDVYASRVGDDGPSAPIKLDVDINSSKEEMVAAFDAVDAETIRQAEAAADLRDLEILLEAENLAEIEKMEKELIETFNGEAYNFSSDQVVYTVQIGAFQKSIKTGTYSEYSGLYNHQYEDGYNRFYSGVFKTEAEAKAHLEQMTASGFDDAFVLGLKGVDRFLVD